MNNLLLTIKIAIKGLLNNKTRAILTMLGIIIGVSSVISIISIGKGAESLITNSLQKIGTNVVAVLPGASNDKGPPASALGIVIKTLTLDDAEAIAKLPHVEYIAPAVSGSADIVYQKNSTRSNYQGTTANKPIVENLVVERGRFFTSQEEKNLSRVAVLGSQVKEDLFGNQNPIGEKIRIGDNLSFKVIGYLETKGSSIFQNPDTEVYIPISTAQKQLLAIDHLNFIRLQVDREENVEKVKESIRNLLLVRHEIASPASADFSVRSITQALDVFGAITAGITFFLASIAAISLVVGGIGITNVMLMTITERTREIGLRKALGAKPSQIRNQFIIETLVLTILGGLIGMLIGITFSYLISLLLTYLGYSWDFVINAASVIISIGVSIFIGLVFGLYPARKAAKLNPIEALRYE